MQVTVSIPTKVHLTETQQKDISFQFVKDKLLGYYQGALPYYDDKADAYLIDIEQGWGVERFKVADGDDEDFASLVRVLRMIHKHVPNCGPNLLEMEKYNPKE